MPAVAASIRLLLGQMIPQTFNSIRMPYAPPMPIEYVLLLAQLWPLTVSIAVKNLMRPQVTNAVEKNMTTAKIRPSLINAGTFLDDQKLEQEQDHRIGQPGKEHEPEIDVAAAEAIRVRDVGLEDVHREVGEAGQDSHDGAPTETTRAHGPAGPGSLFLRVGVEAFLDRNVDEVEEVEQADPGDAGDEVEPAEDNPH